MPQPISGVALVYANDSCGDHAFEKDEKRQHKLMGGKKQLPSELLMATYKDVKDSLVSSAAP